MNKISWKAYEYKKKEKTADWYWAVVIIALSIIIISFLLRNGLFAILMIIGVTTLLIFSSKEPQVMEVNIDPRGITLGKEKYPFATLEEFWIDTSDEKDYKILLKSKKALMPLISVPIEEYHYLDIRDVLLDFLPEAELHEPFSQKIMERLGF